MFEKYFKDDLRRTKEPEISNYAKDFSRFLFEFVPISQILKIFKDNNVSLDESQKNIIRDLYKNGPSENNDFMNKFLEVMEKNGEKDNRALQFFQNKYSEYLKKPAPVLEVESSEIVYNRSLKIIKENFVDKLNVLVKQDNYKNNPEIQGLIQKLTAISKLIEKSDALLVDLEKAKGDLKKSLLGCREDTDENNSKSAEEQEKSEEAMVGAYVSSCSQAILDHLSLKDPECAEFSTSDTIARLAVDLEASKNKGVIQLLKDFKLVQQGLPVVADRGLTLQSLLQGPMQRGMRYGTLLETIVDKYPLEKDKLNKVKEVILDVNERKKQQEDISHLKTLKDELGKKEGTKDNEVSRSLEFSFSDNVNFFKKSSLVKLKDNFLGKLTTQLQTENITLEPSVGLKKKFFITVKDGTEEFKFQIIKGTPGSPENGKGASNAFYVRIEGNVSSFDNQKLKKLYDMAAKIGVLATELVAAKDFSHLVNAAPPYSHKVNKVKVDGKRYEEYIDLDEPDSETRQNDVEKSRLLGVDIAREQASKAAVLPKATEQKNDVASATGGVATKVAMQNLVVEPSIVMPALIQPNVPNAAATAESTPTLSEPVIPVDTGSEGSKIIEKSEIDDSEIDDLVKDLESDLGSREAINPAAQLTPKTAVEIAAGLPAWQMPVDNGKTDIPVPSQKNQDISNLVSVLKGVMVDEEYEEGVEDDAKDKAEPVEVSKSAAQLLAEIKANQKVEAKGQVDDSSEEATLAVADNLVNPVVRVVPTESLRKEVRDAFDLKDNERTNAIIKVINKIRDELQAFALDKNSIMHQQSITELLKIIKNIEGNATVAYPDKKKSENPVLKGIVTNLRILSEHLKNNSNALPEKLDWEGVAPVEKTKFKVKLGIPKSNNKGKKEGGRTKFKLLKAKKEKKEIEREPSENPSLSGASAIVETQTDLSAGSVSADTKDASLNDASNNKPKRTSLLERLSRKKSIEEDVVFSRADSGPVAPVKEKPSDDGQSKVEETKNDLTEALNEILNSEVTYLKNLQPLQAFIEELNKSSGLSEDHKILLKELGRVQGILDMSTRLIADIERAREESKGDNLKYAEAISIIFTKHAKEWNAGGYDAYVQGFDKLNAAINLVEKTENETKESSIYKEARAKLKLATNSDLVSLAIQPVQRLPRYKLLLEAAVKHLPAEVRDSKEIKEAMDAIATANTQLNESKRPIDALVDLKKELDMAQPKSGSKRKWNSRSSKADASSEELAVSFSAAIDDILKGNPLGKEGTLKILKMFLQSDFNANHKSNSDGSISPSGASVHILAAIDKLEPGYSESINNPWTKKYDIPITFESSATLGSSVQPGSPTLSVSSVLSQSLSSSSNATPKPLRLEPEHEAFLKAAELAQVTIAAETASIVEKAPVPVVAEALVVSEDKITTTLDQQPESSKQASVGLDSKDLSEQGEAEDLADLLARRAIDSEIFSVNSDITPSDITPSDVTVVESGSDTAVSLDFNDLNEALEDALKVQAQETKKADIEVEQAAMTDEAREELIGELQDFEHKDEPKALSGDRPITTNPLEDLKELNQQEEETRGVGISYLEPLVLRNETKDFLQADKLSPPEVENENLESIEPEQVKTDSTVLEEIVTSSEALIDFPDLVLDTPIDLDTVVARLDAESNLAELASTVSETNDNMALTSASDTVPASSQVVQERSNLNQVANDVGVTFESSSDSETQARVRGTLNSVAMSSSNLNVVPPQTQPVATAASEIIEQRVAREREEEASRGAPPAPPLPQGQKLPEQKTDASSVVPIIASVVASQPIAEPIVGSDPNNVVLPVPPPPPRDDNVSELIERLDEDNRSAPNPTFLLKRLEENGILNGIEELMDASEPDAKDLTGIQKEVIERILSRLNQLLVEPDPDVDAAKVKAMISRVDKIINQRPVNAQQQPTVLSDDMKTFEPDESGSDPDASQQPPPPPPPEFVELVSDSIVRQQDAATAAARLQLVQLMEKLDQAISVTGEYNDNKENYAARDLKFHDLVLLVNSFRKLLIEQDKNLTSDNRSQLVSNLIKLKEEIYSSDESLSKGSVRGVALYKFIEELHNALSHNAIYPAFPEKLAQLLSPPDANAGYSPKISGLKNAEHMQWGGVIREVETKLGKFDETKEVLVLLEAQPDLYKIIDNLDRGSYLLSESGAQNLHEMMINIIKNLQQQNFQAALNIAAHVPAKIGAMYDSALKILQLLKAKNALLDIPDNMFNRPQAAPQAAAVQVPQAVQVHANQQSSALANRMTGLNTQSNQSQINGPALPNTQSIGSKSSNFQHNLLFARYVKRIDPQPKIDNRITCDCSTFESFVNASVLSEKIKVKGRELVALKENSKEGKSTYKNLHDNVTTDPDPINKETLNAKGPLGTVTFKDNANNTKIMERSFNQEQRKADIRIHTTSDLAIMTALDSNRGFKQPMTIGIPSDRNTGQSISNDQITKEDLDFILKSLISSKLMGIKVEVDPKYLALIKERVDNDPNCGPEFKNFEANYKKVTAASRSMLLRKHNINDDQKGKTSVQGLDELLQNVLSKEKLTRKNTSTGPSLGP